MGVRGLRLGFGEVRVRTPGVGGSLESRAHVVRGRRPNAAPGEGWAEGGPEQESEARGDSLPGKALGQPLAGCMGAVG